jgi:hypothetical protein
MNKHLANHKGTLIIIFFMFFLACTSTTDINNEKAVMKDIQGEWIRNMNFADMYRHIKLSIDGNSFKAWVQMSEYEDEPDWLEFPDEKGRFTLSSLIEDKNKNINYRKFTFSCEGRCCRDKSVAIESLTELLTFVERKGLTIGEKMKMVRR